jgi:hypothetical protein
MRYSDGRFWHETDMPTALRDVRSQGQSGKHMLALSFSGFDPIGDIDRFEIPQRGGRLCYFFCSEAGEGTEQSNGARSSSS